MPAPGSPGIHPAADLFVGQGDSLAPWRSDVAFFSGTTGDATAGPGFPFPQLSHPEPPAFNLPKADQAQRPRPHLVQGETHAGSEGEPSTFRLRYSLTIRTIWGHLARHRLRCLQGSLLLRRDGYPQRKARTFKNSAHIPSFTILFVRPTLTRFLALFLVKIHPSTHLSNILSLNGSLGQECHHGICQVRPVNTAPAFLEGGTTIQPRLTLPHTHCPTIHPSTDHTQRALYASHPPCRTMAQVTQTTAARVPLPMDQIFILVVQLMEVMKSIPIPIVPQHPIHKPTPSLLLPQAILLLPLVQPTPQCRSPLISSIPVDTLLVLACRNVV